MADEEFINREAETTIDEAMLEIGDFVSQMSDIDGYLTSEEAEFALEMEKVDLDMPLQLDIRVAEDGRVNIGSSPPLYYVETTIMPVFHQIQISIDVDKTIS